MLITYFKDPRTLARYRSGLANIYLEDFITWLESQGYRRFMIRRHVRGLVHFTEWAEAEGLTVGDLDRGALNRLCSQLEERKSLRYPSGNRRCESEPIRSNSSGANARRCWPTASSTTMPASYRNCSSAPSAGRITNGPTRSSERTRLEEPAAALTTG